MLNVIFTLLFWYFIIQFVIHVNIWIGIILMYGVIFYYISRGEKKQ